MPLPARRCRVSFNIKLETHIAQNVYWFKPLAAPPTDWDVDAAATGAYNLLKPVYQQFTSHEVKLLGVDLLCSYDGLAYAGHNYVNEDGELPGDALPDECAAVVSLRTAHPGRSGRGRLFLPGIAESVTTESRLDSGTADSIRLQLESLWTSSPGLAGVSMEFSVCSPHTGALYAITGANVEPVICHQRRRRPVR